MWLAGWVTQHRRMQVASREVTTQGSLTQLVAIGPARLTASGEVLTVASRDGKWRVEPGTFHLAHGATARVGRLRAYGNAINAEAART